MLETLGEFGVKQLVISGVPWDKNNQKWPTSEHQCLQKTYRYWSAFAFS